ncbi:Protein of unknown function, partial [Gryllus bimaculatus]
APPAPALDPPAPPAALTQATGAPICAFDSFDLHAAPALPHAKKEEAELTAVAAEKEEPAGAKVRKAAEVEADGDFSETEPDMKTDFVSSLLASDTMTSALNEEVARPSLFVSTAAAAAVPPAPATATAIALDAAKPPPPEPTPAPTLPIALFKGLECSRDMHVLTMSFITISDVLTGVIKEH